MNYRSELEFKLRYDANIPISEVLFRINQQLNLYKHFIIVEGIGDVVFYGNSNVLRNIDKPKIIAAPSKNIDEIIGKKYVINSYQLIKQSKLGKESTSVGRSIPRCSLLILWISSSDKFTYSS